MKEWIQQDWGLLTLYRGIKRYSSPAMVGHKARPANSETAARAELSREDKDKAAKLIQRAWRGYKNSKALTKTPYEAYLSMVSKDDEQRLLSSLMFGRHEAEIRKHYNDRILNPHIHNSAHYHRCDDLSGSLLNELKKEFDITDDMLSTCIMIPVTELKTVSIDDFISKNIVSQLKIIRQPSRSIAIVLVPRKNSAVRSAFVSAGLIASPWEIAQNVKNPKLLDALDSKTKVTMHMQGLPRTKEELLNSDLFTKLNKIAKNKKYPTHKLASSLVQLIQNSDQLNPDAINRIALIVDMANTFYANYPRFAFCVYAIVHELSLRLALQTDPGELDVAFKRFLNEAEDSLTHSLGLEKADLENMSFIACPALSGTNAFMIAKRIASSMKITSGKRPTVRMYEPCYYELNTHEFSKTNSSDPDIFVFSTGPIVNVDGLTPGVDVNKFVRENIIQNGRTAPATLIIDATTTLYKNLHLDDDVKQLVQDGKLSILVFESHQKFGLLHTDQAQYGRMFGLCAKGSYDENVIKQIQQDVQSDFNQHLDMRVGANINHCCSNTLEQIKQRHFTNGAILNTILDSANIVSSRIVKHKYMLKNLEEHYFITPRYSWEHFWKLIPLRNSFGHYSTTLSFVADLARVCANASDDTDTLIISARIYLALTQRGHEKIIIKNSRALSDLSEEEQIISVAMTHNLLNPRLNTQPQTLIEKIELYCALRNISNACKGLSGRDSYERIISSYFDLQRQIVKDADIYGINPDFLSVLQVLYNANITLTAELLKSLQLSATLCSFLVKINKVVPSLHLSNDLVIGLAEHPGVLSQLAQNQDFFVKQKGVLEKISSLGIEPGFKTLVALTGNKKALTVLNLLLERGFPLNSESIKILEATKIVEFIAKHQTLSLESILALSKLNAAGVQLSDVAINLAKDNALFCKLISLVYDANAAVLTHLKDKENGTKYKAAVEYTPRYLKECYTSIATYCTNDTPNNGVLQKEIKQANKNYCDTVLSKDRSKLTLTAKGIFKGLILAIAGIFLLAVPDVLKNIYNYRFFKTDSEKKLTAVDQHIEDELNPTKK